MDVFDDPTVHTCIIGLSKNKSLLKTNIRKQVWSKDELNSTFIDAINLVGIIDTTSYSINITLSFSERVLFDKLNKFKPLKEICHIRQCIKTGNDIEYVIKSNVKLAEPWKKGLRGKGIGRYLIVEDDLYLKYGPFLARNWNNISFYETPKIAVRETGKRIIATLDLENRYFLSSLYSIYPLKEFDIDFLKSLLAIINSNLATFYIRKIAFDLTEGAFTKVRTNQLGRLPIPPIDEHIIKIFSVKVDQILLFKARDSNTDISSLESEIDQLVYELYGLTEDEIKIVESR